MFKTVNLTLAAGLLTATTLLSSGAFAQTAFPGGDDAETTAVQTAINKDLGLRVDHVQVQTIDGTVYLHGRVDSQGAVDRAEEIARSVPNVDKIVNTVSDSEYAG